MSLEGYAVIFFLIYIAGLALVSWRARSADSGEGYIIGGRKVGLWPTTAAIVAVLRSGSAIPFWCILVAACGLYALIPIAVYYLFILFMGVIAPQVRAKSVQHNLITIPDILGVGLGRYSSLIALAAALYAALLYSAAQIFIGGTVFAGLFNMPTYYGIITSVAVVGAYLWLGGYMTLIKTDLIQFLVIIALAVGAYFYTDFNTVLQTAPKPDWLLVFGMCMTAPVILAQTDIWQRLYSAESGATARRACFLACIIDLVIVTGLVFFISGILSGFDVDNPGAIFEGFFSGDHANPAVTALFGVFIFAMLMSSLDNQIYIFTSHITRNILNIDARTQRRRFIGWLRVLTIAMMIGLTLIALTIDDIVRFLLDNIMLVVLIGPPIAYAAISQGPDRRADLWLSASMLLGLGVYMVLLLYGYFANMAWYIVPFAIPALTAVTLLFILKPYHNQEV